MGIAQIPAPSGGLTQTVTTFTSSGTFTLPSGYGVSKPLWVQVLMGGGGGGGGGGGATTITNTAGGGGGGGSGIVAGFFTSLTANQTVTIGAGGTAGNGGAQNTVANGTAGGAGGTTIFGDYRVPGGRGGGQGSNSNNQSAPGQASITAFGYYIKGGSGNNTALGFGGAGGSGGGAGNTDGTTYGHGSPLNGFYQNGGGGLTDIALYASNQTPNEYNIAYNHDFNQRGGGAGGYQTNTSARWGKGGLAGGILGGTAQAADTTVAAEAVGQTATVPSAGAGGGGGACGSPGGNAGAGGVGAAGFVTITYWS